VAYVFVVPEEEEDVTTRSGSSGATSSTFHESGERREYAVTSRTEIHVLEEHRIVLSDPIQGKFKLPCASLAEAQDWQRTVEHLVLPLGGRNYVLATEAATSAAIGRLLHLETFLRVYENYKEDGKRGKFNPIRGEDDHDTLVHLRDMAV